MAEINSRHLQILILVVLLLLLSNFAISCMAIAKVNRSANDYVVTEARFARAVHDSTTNFLSSLSSHLVSRSTNQVTRTDTTDFKLLSGLCVYYSYLRREWVARYQGFDYFEGDYFPEGLIVGIVRGRLYCRNDKGFVVVRPAADEGGDALRPPSPPLVEDAPL